MCACACHVASVGAGGKQGFSKLLSKLPCPVLGQRGMVGGMEGRMEGRMEGGREVGRVR
jgi:hypothetical protein